MNLYHGSYIEIPNPDIKHSRRQVDFGQGFYTTPLKDQAKKWCNKFKRDGKKGIISKYNFDDKILTQLKVITFKTYSEKWLDFVLTCRKGKDPFDYDIVIGGIANDKVFNTIELYFDGLIDKNEAIKRLRYNKPNLQICFRSQTVIDKHLHFIGSEQTWWQTPYYYKKNTPE